MTFFSELAIEVVGSTTRPPRPLPDTLRVGGEADIVRTPVAINPGLLVGQRHFHGASTNERVPLLAVVNERTTRFWRVHNRKQ